MPNWVANCISFDYMTDEEWEAFKKKHFTEQGDFDFNTIIPEPQTLSECDEKYRMENDEEVKDIQVDEKKPWFNWSDFCCDKWGTKWNACDTICGIKYISFNTAWSPPFPIIEMLAKLYPQYEMSYDYAEEQGAEYCGHGWKDADDEKIFINEYESGSKEAWEVYFDMWGGEEEYYYDDEEGTYVYDYDEHYKEIAELKKDVVKILNME